MPLCPHCEKEISYAAREKLITKEFNLPVVEISCSQCKTVINVVVAPDYYFGTIQSTKEES